MGVTALSDTPLLRRAIFGGAAGVLLQKSISYAEVYNENANFFCVMRDLGQPIG
ncbi:hypothetical protein [Delftia acidovorans]